MLGVSQGIAVMHETKPVEPFRASPFHEGERTVQQRAGARAVAVAARLGSSMVRDFMPDQHRLFFAELPYLMVASLDPEGRPWASVLAGRPGFAVSPDPHHLVVSAPIHEGDRLRHNLRIGAPLGLLGIQFETRRRNRMNGTVEAIDDTRFAVRVRQSFGNCPQYIQARAPALAERLPEAVEAEREGALLSRRAADLVGRSDTCFIASASQAPGDDGRAEGIDMSHRGGKPGFVRVIAEDRVTVLTLPDFRGNFLFNTLGNIVANPHAGFMVIDFASGDVLSLTGLGEVVFDGPELAAFAGAERLLRFRVAEGVFLQAALPFRWSEPALSPQLADTGSWGAAELP
jgi:predicted pyridoxine 5'-phosphate oxidase superfamily flavin-nucleotide-binding protein